MMTDSALLRVDISLFTCFHTLETTVICFSLIDLLFKSNSVLAWIMKGEAFGITAAGFYRRLPNQQRQSEFCVPLIK